MSKIAKLCLNLLMLCRENRRLVLFSTVDSYFFAPSRHCVINQSINLFIVRYRDDSRRWMIQVTRQLTLLNDVSREMDQHASSASRCHRLLQLNAAASVRTISVLFYVILTSLQLTPTVLSAPPPVLGKCYRPIPASLISLYYYYYYYYYYY